MNLCTLVVIYKYERRAPEQPQIAMDQVREFRQAWLKYDPRGSGVNDIPASAYAGAAGAVTAGATVANPVGHSAELDYTGPELAHSAELDYAGGDDLPELLPREAAQAPAPRGFARPGDLPSGGVV